MGDSRQPTPDNLPRNEEFGSMFPRILLAVSDQQCARIALHTLETLSAHPGGELIVLGLVQPFPTVYVHQHPWIGRRIRALRHAVMSDQMDDVQRFVRERYWRR